MHEALDAADVEWMNRQLSERAAGAHAFVFGHKGIITESHTDTLFGANPSLDPSLQDTFMRDLQRNGVHYYVGGHDHMYNRALVASPDFKWHVQDIIAQSDASTFGVPKGAGGGVINPLPNPAQTNDMTYDVPAFGAPREKEIAQQAAPGVADRLTASAHVGYFVVTIDGPRVTVNYYSAPVKVGLSGLGWALQASPALSFTRQETFGYSRNGKEFYVPGGGSYRVIADQFQGTKAKVLGGVNSSKAADAAGRKLTRDVTTGWTHPTSSSGLASNILVIDGLSSVAASASDTYTLALSTSDERGQFSGTRLLASKDAIGRWVNAVNLNSGGRAKFVRGSWRAGDTLGTYGFDAKTATAWAVVNHCGTFALADRAQLRSEQSRRSRPHVRPNPSRVQKPLLTASRQSACRTAAAARDRRRHGRPGIA